MQFQSSLSQWFVLLQQQNYKKLSKESYVDLNVKIQKSLILDFDEESARESAEQDWKIDLEREQQERKQTSRTGGLEPVDERDKDSDSEESSEEFDEQDERFMNDEEKERLQKRREARDRRRERKAEELDRRGIDYERLTEFFFDLCLSWCQFLDIETFLFFINGVFLNITKGQHVNVSKFKETSEIEVLSIEFINHLLAYRQICSERVARSQTYGQWYALNFGRTHSIVNNVEKNLLEAFRGRNENRILDIWVDLPPQIVNQFINQHFEKIERDIGKMDRAAKATQKLSQSIQVMEQLKRVPSSTQAPQLLHKRYTDSAAVSFARESAALPKKPALQIFNDKTANQQVIEKRLVGQLGERFVHADLIEINRNSYLISNRVRMPVFGRSVKPIERTEESISRKGYLLMKDSEFYTSSRVFTNQVFGVSNALQHKYVLDPVAFVVISQQENAQLLMQQQVDPALFSKGQPPTLPQTQGGVENTIDSVEMQGSQTQEMAR